MRCAEHPALFSKAGKWWTSKPRDCDFRSGSLASRQVRQLLAIGRDTAAYSKQRGGRADGENVAATRQGSSSGWAETARRVPLSEAKYSPARRAGAQSQLHKPDTIMDMQIDGRPVSKVLVKTTLANNELVSLTASHDLFEMIIDPIANLPTAQ